MDYNEALQYIHGTYKFGIKLGLHNIKTLLELMDNPQDKLQYIHVAGTNGKGSTVTYISSILIESGYKVGIYTSPYIERFTERIKINNVEIPEEDLARITGLVKSKVEIMVERGENHPTEFEVVTATAFQYFYEKACDIVVLEVGLGGRFDSTNVINTPLVSVITTISYDHMDRLGDTLEKIAFEKAGIIKNNGDVVIYPAVDSVEEVFSRKCSETGSRLWKTDFNSLTATRFDIWGQLFNYKNFKDLEISLLGEHQVKNAAVAIEASGILKAKGFNISEDSIRNGLKNAKWPGRLEVVNRKPVFIIDGAHNPEAAGVLADALEKYFPDKRKVMIMGVFRDKDYMGMIKVMAPLADSFITVTPASERALPAEELANFIKHYCKNVSISDRIEDAIKSSMQTDSEGSVICAFGSLSYIGEIREFFNVKRF